MKNSFSFNSRHFHLTETIYQQPKRKKNMHLLVLQNQHGACLRTEEEKKNCFFIILVLGFYALAFKMIFLSQARCTCM